MNLLLTNKHGAERATCQRHVAYYQPMIWGSTVTGETGKECEKCRKEITHLVQPWKVFQSLTSPKFAHTRFRRLFGSDCVHIYHRDEKSPTGVLLAAAFDADRFDKMFNELRALGMIRSSASPLSPTEGLS